LIPIEIYPNAMGEERLFKYTLTDLQKRPLEYLIDRQHFKNIGHITLLLATAWLMIVGPRKLKGVPLH
jgi:hypothetical protein